jgi:hypothetical protein
MEKALKEAKITATASIVSKKISDSLRGSYFKKLEKLTTAEIIAEKNRKIAEEVRMEEKNFIANAKMECS